MLIIRFCLCKPTENSCQKLGSLIEAGVIRPVVDKVFPFEANERSNVLRLKWSCQRESHCQGQVVLPVNAVFEIEASNEALVMWRHSVLLLPV